jgi:hypothetical protein
MNLTESTLQVTARISPGKRDFRKLTFANRPTKRANPFDSTFTSASGQRGVTQKRPHPTLGSLNSKQKLHAQFSSGLKVT